MKCKADIADLKSDLLSIELTVQTAALEEAKKTIDEIMGVAVQGLEHTTNKSLYADWLSRWGPMIVPDLEKLYLASATGETRTHAAIMLLYFGSSVGLTDVMAALTPEDPLQFFAASKLANAGIVEASAPIMDLLRAHVFTQPLDQEEQASKIHTLISSLKKLGVEVPEDIKERLTAPGVSKYISAIVTRPMR